MEILIWILVIYAGNIFLTRYLNYLCMKLDKGDTEPIVGLWFVPALGPLFMLIVLIIVYFENDNSKWLTWFTGKDWNDKFKID